jgi:hypothetical protein
MGSICRFEYVGSRRNIFADRSLHYNCDSVFVAAVSAAIVAVVAVAVSHVMSLT